MKTLLRRHGLALLCAALAICLPLCMEDSDYAMRIATMALIFAAASQCWNLSGGLANQISLGHAAFFGIGAYTSTLLYIHLEVSPWLGLVAGGMLAAVAAAMLSVILSRLKGHYYALATLAFAEVLRVVANSWSSVTGGPIGLTIPFKGDAPLAFQFSSPAGYYWISLGLLALCSLVFHRLASGASGYRLRAIRENEVAAEVSGIDTFRLKLRLNVLSGALMAMCGTVYAQFIYFFDPDSIFSLSGISVKVAMMSIIGGLGTLPGPILGAFFLVPLEELSTSFFSDTAGLAQCVFGIVLIAAILIQPRGLMAVWGLRHRFMKGART
ncbi:MAG: branched-chain amino acid ABC transporter permease [Zoogloeaceae bacterium]|jgi:branched-chain amino acid transport system permease protein|nr:branched-chain amino acid ABC transporter permease [Zoogloeaceae bacterium]